MTTSTDTTPRSTRARGPLPKWAIPLGIAAAVLLLVVGPLISSRNRLIDKDEAVNQQFGQVEVQQQRRFDLIPNLVEAAKAAQIQEQTIFGDIANARSRYAGAQNTEEKVAATNQLETSLARLLVITEAYPDLKSQQVLQNLMVQLEGTENRISQERRTYNEVVTEYNRSIRRFPTSVVAGMSGFDRRELFVGTAGSADAPKIDLNTSGK